MKTTRTEGERLTRRELLESSLSGVAVAAVVIAMPRLASAGRTSAGTSSTEAASDLHREPAEPLGLKAGLRLGRWTVLDVRFAGQSIALMVRGPEGEPYQLDVLARDPSRPGVADSRRYSVFLVNGGNGSTRSEEQRARGALAVGHYLRWAEDHVESGPALVTMSERMRTDPDGSYRFA